MAVLWYYSEGELATGPITTEVVRQMIAAGTLQPTQHIWPKGFSRRMAVEVSVLEQALSRDASENRLPEWLSDVAEAETASVPDWIQDVRNLEWWTICSPT